MPNKKYYPQHSSQVIATHARLKSLVCRLAQEEGKIPTQVDGLCLTRRSAIGKTDACFYAPSVGIIVQGTKESLIGSELYRYGEMDCLVNGVDIPSISTMLDASPEKPLLAVSLDLDKNIVMELAAEIPVTAGFADSRGITIAPVSLDVLDTFTRLVELLDKPEELSIWAPLLVREIIARVLVGPQGAPLRKAYTVGSHSNQVGEAITWLRANFTTPLQVEALADMVGMATSTFHRQFKKVTSISPLQFQKCLRLHEAQRLMLVVGMDASNAGRAVGYDSVQQFNREYKRLFSEPPHRNVKRLRQE